MDELLAAAIAVFTVLAGLGLLGACLLYLRRGFVKERDEVQHSTNAALRESLEAHEALCEARLAEREEWIGRLERHHDAAHRRCASLPSRDG